MEKVSIIGAGNVGASAAYALLIQGVASVIALVDINAKKAMGEALDLMHGMQFAPRAKILHGSSYDLCAGSDIIVITAGIPQKPGETRLQVVDKNAKIMKSIIPQVAKAAPDAVILIISNPVDILTYLAIKYSGFPPERVFGSGTTLDSARFRYYLGEHFQVSPQSVQAFILGEHGDSEFPVLSSATIGGLNLSETEGYDEKEIWNCFEKTKNAAYEVIDSKGATYYAIGLGIAKICTAVLNNEQHILPVSTLINNYYDEGDVCLSIPCVIGKGGIQKRFQLPLDDREQNMLHISAKVLKEVLENYK